MMPCGAVTAVRLGLCFGVVRHRPHFSRLDRVSRRLPGHHRKPVARAAQQM